MTTQNKVYRINGKEIKQAGAWEDDKNFGHNDVNDVVNQLLEALSDKQECKHKNTGNCLACYREEIEPKQEELVERDPIMRNRHIICPIEPKQSTSLKEETDWSIDSIVKEIGYIFTDDIIKLKLCVGQAEKKAKIQLAELICAMAGDRIYSFSSGDVSRERASEIGNNLCKYLKEYIIESKN